MTDSNSPSEILAAVQKQSPEEAVLTLGNAIEQHPDIPEFWSELAKCDLALSRPADAIEAVATALSLDPQNTDARVLKINALRQLGRREDVEAEFAVLSEQNPSLTAALRTTYLMLEGDYEKADEALHGIRGHPDRPLREFASLFSILSALRQGDFQKAGRRAMEAQRDGFDPQSMALWKEMVEQGVADYSRYRGFLKAAVVAGAISENQSEELRVHRVEVRPVAEGFVDPKWLAVHAEAGIEGLLGAHARSRIFSDEHWTTPIDRVAFRVGRPPGGRD